jgi:hypothetical protein
MGFSVSWIAFQGKAKQQVLEITRLVDTGEIDEANESPICGAELPGAWYVLFLNDVVHSFVSAEHMKRFSIGCTVLGCQVEEHVMASASFLYCNGTRVWNITHESEKGLYNLEVDGSPPEWFSIGPACQKQDAAGGKSAGVDYIFDVIALGMLASDTPKGKVSLRFPVHALEDLFPHLYPQT